MAQYNSLADLPAAMREQAAAKLAGENGGFGVLSPSNAPSLSRLPKRENRTTGATQAQTAGGWRDAGTPAKRSKYGSKKKEVDGHLFDSTKESNRYKTLRLLERDGRIGDLQLQFPLQLIVAGQLICTYYADFAYTQDGERKIEDVKSAITRKKPDYRIKAKLVKALYGYEITEI